MGYDRGDSSPFNFEPNGNLFGLKSKKNINIFFGQDGNPFASKSKVKLSPRSYPIQFERK